MGRAGGPAVAEREPWPTPRDLQGSGGGGWGSLYRRRSGGVTESSGGGSGKRANISRILWGVRTRTRELVMLAAEAAWEACAAVLVR